MWPSSIEFSEAVQNPFICFTDTDLKTGTAAVDRLGMPLVASGQFASVFKLQIQNQAQAIRCFTRQLGDRAKRYATIDLHLDKSKNIPGIQCLAKYEYEPEGIVVRGQKYPILVMEWIQGNTLDVYVEDNLNNKQALLFLADQWLRLVSSLKNAQVAHGDMQHGNIIVQSDLQLRLVDLDGMYVPEMNGLKACELGHRDYQHPNRSLDNFGCSVDNFSALVIYTSLLSLAYHPDLWKKFHNEGLILKQIDFKNPQSSFCFKAMQNGNNELNGLLKVLQDSCYKSPESVPFLSDLVAPASKSRLPIWMLAPIDTNVTVKTRENTTSQPVQTPQYQPVYTSAAVVNGSNTVISPTSSAVKAQTPTSSSAKQKFHYEASEMWNGFKRFLVPWIILIALNPTPDGFWSWTLIYIITAFIFGAIKSSKKASNTHQTGGVTIYAASKPNVLSSASISSNNINPNISNAGTPSAAGANAAPCYSAPNYVPVSANMSNASSSSSSSRGAIKSSKISNILSAFSTNSAKQIVLMGSNSRFIYHRSSCKWAAKISSRNLVTFSSGNEARCNGYKACRVCHPPV